MEHALVEISVEGAVRWLEWQRYRSIEGTEAPLLDMPVLFFRRALRLFLAGNDQAVAVQANVDILLVDAGKLSRYFEGIFCFRHIDCRPASPNFGKGKRIR